MRLRRLRRRAVFEDLSRPRLGEMQERRARDELRPDTTDVAAVLPVSRRILLGAIGLAPKFTTDGRSGRPDTGDAQ